LWFFGWRTIFWMLAAIGAVALTAAYFRLPETLRPEYRQPLVLKSILQRFGELVRHRAFMGYAFTSSFMFAALLSFLSGSPFVFIERYGVSPRSYGLIFGSLIIFMTIGSLLNARFAPRVGPGRILRYAVYVPLITGVAAIVLGGIEARYGTIGMWPIVACFAPQIATISLIGPNSMAMALHRYPHMAGTASSLMGVMQFGLGAAFGAVVGQTYDGTIGPMTMAMGLAGILCFVSNRLLVPR
jgi:DHA1 family bicyclomycin/chloramphenicol resistance-like MFS transporter